MAVSNEEYNAILSRLTKLERSFNDVAVAIDKFITINQVHQLTTMHQTDLDALNVIVQALQTRVTAIEQDPTG